MSEEAQSEARIVDGRNRDFFIVDNPVIDQKIEQVEAKRRADVGWTYAVLCRLADNETGEATLKLSYLANKTGRSKPVVIECLKWLVKLGLLTKRENRKNGRQAASTYVLLSVSRVKDENPEAEVQSNQGEDSRVNTDNRITKTIPSTKTNVEANASSAIAQSDEVIGLEKHIVDGIYLAMREANFRLPNEHFTYHLGRAKDVLEKDDPTDEEIEGLPEAFVGLWTIKGKADAHSALMEMRRQKVRPDLVRVDSGPAPWEPKNPHSPKPPMDPEKLAKEKARREEVARMLASAS